MSAYPDTRLFIDGAWRPADDGQTIPVVNPATGLAIGQVARAGEADIARAVIAARKGFAAWSRVGAFERYSVIRRAASLLRERVDAIARLMTIEQGKPLVEARTEILGSADILDWLAEEGRRAYGRLVPPRSPDVTQMVLRTPIGPVAGFSPWNFPISQAARKLGAALATGCSIILKAPEETPASPAALVQVFIDAGLPGDVLSLLYGVPAEISSRLIPDPAIRKISFTGSTAVGRELAAMAGRHMKRSTMELGGHAPVIVAADADLDQAAALLAASKFRNAGQVCVSPTRFLVERPAYDGFLDRFLSHVSTVKPGDGLDATTTMGPLAHERRVNAIEALIDNATSLGARVETGGGRMGNAGYFFQPTVVTGLTPDMQIMNEEPFGPVALITPVENVDAALKEANRLDYGLAAYAFTRSGATATRLRDEVRSGMLTINHLGLALPETPFGGIGDSGYGSEGGAEAIEPYLETRFVTHKTVL
ncbi:NAD-dependent succinate-semialdehyde dehydrogenase [Acetobacter sp. DsW_063]|uniref:NAD-dependent succinate-semialdehyde dehydrogenase n=1 Tax=Acetobacter sp. DsW_063 TaxID=1514894 RepID=UPI000A39EDE0|nr:NAD-dependent succinate-semialdehyde dehydrogenase [Acetobacter sp. DsW_063]OUJ14777.1 aldehyde dehydrogenase [Acetobacter sp. DsW_063]